MNWLLQLLGRKPMPSSMSGGLTLTRDKPGLPDSDKVETLALPTELVFPMLNYRKESIPALVKPGQHVERGEALAKGIVATARGTVTAIENRAIVHASHREEICVVIAPDKQQSKDKRIHAELPILTIDRLQECAVQGLGGAGYFTAEKFKAGFDDSKPLELLLINAVECEPMISCDEALIMCEAHSMVEAVHALIKMTRCTRCVIAIEVDKTAAIAALREAIQLHEDSHQTDPGEIATMSISLRGSSVPVAAGNTVTGPETAIELIELAPIYPSGAERLLVERISGLRLKTGDHPAKHGIVCINIATALAAWRAQLGEAMCSRVITIAGERATNPVNVRVVLGTSVADALAFSGNLSSLDQVRVRIGGPLSGFDLTSLDVPVTATTNSISIEVEHKLAPQTPCIRCGKCSDVCPVKLLPQQLYSYATNEDNDGTDRYGLGSCIECACCDLVCPSNIPLTAMFRYAKSVQLDKQRTDQLAVIAQSRFMLREQRELKRRELRKARRDAAKEKLAGSADPIADALARARNRRRKP